MNVFQLRVALFSVIVIVSSCLPLATTAPWNEKDGMKFIIPRQMARLLTKITKQNSDQDESLKDPLDMQTTLKLMHLNGLRKGDEPQMNKTMPMENDSDLIERRGRRSVKTNSAPPTCQSGRVWVNLTMYKEIIAPLGFYTHYCGSTFLLPVGNDPIVQILSQAIVDAFNSVKKYSAKVLTNPSCCAPKKIHDLYVLYFDEHKVSVIRNIPNVKASRCSCKND